MKHFENKILKTERYTRIIFLAAMAALTVVATAQQEEVKVVKPYTPTLSGADKIQLLPRIGDSISHEHPEFEYRIFSKRYETGYRVTPIKPARMVQPTLNKLYKSELTLGGGNYLTPLAELRINQVRSSKGTAGLFLKHHSMNGSVRLANDQKVDAGFNENSMEFYGKRFLRRSIFEYNAGASYDIYQHYGVDTTYADSVTRDGMSHPFFNGHAEIAFQSARPDSFHFQYKGSLQYDFFTHDFDQMEHGAVLDATISDLVRDFRVGGDLGVSYFGHPTTWDTLLTNHFIIKLNPFVSKSSSEWDLKVGLNTYTEVRNGNVIPHFYPRAKFSFNIVENILVPYMGVDGHMESNNYMKITRENPYVVPGLVVTPTNYRIIAFAGFKGKITDYLTWDLKASYANIDNQYFFATDTSNYLNNQFLVAYDSLTMMNVSAELNISPTGSFRTFIKGNYYYYQMDNLLGAWYKPVFDVSLLARYNVADKIIADAGLYVIGPRSYPQTALTANPVASLKTTVDLNLGVEYRYNTLLSFWARFNNITAQPYYMWHNYPSYRFRFMLGFTYAL
ncbi:MAG: hypothetical protein K9J30_03030 [Bacteroidales bacterium]|nr:hypothetical protein [Bacteroidales bacterium]